MIRALAVALATLIWAAPAFAQVPCGVVDPCPTPTPTPVPTTEPTPSPTPPIPITITLSRKPRIIEAGKLTTFRGRIRGDGYRDRLGTTAIWFRGTVPAFGGRALAPEPIEVDDRGRFEVTVRIQATSRFVVRTSEGGGLVGASPVRTVRAIATTYVVGSFGELGNEPFQAALSVYAPSRVTFFDGRSRPRGPLARRAYLYVGKGRRLRRFDSGRFRQDGDPEHRIATFRVAQRRFPPGRFHYAACFPGTGGRGLVPPFVNCGAPYFRLRR